MTQLTLAAVMAGLVVLYLVANWPFMKLVCHQDAGWHAYWPTFRRWGVSLRWQLNTLMGCTRLGVKFLHVLSLPLLGRQDPDASARRLFLALNIGTALLLFFAVQQFAEGIDELGLVVVGLYLANTANPLFGVHYDTAERSVFLLNGAIFLLVAIYLGVPSGGLIFAIVFAMFVAAVLFKITQLIEYFFLWLYLALTRFDELDVVLSTGGAAAALGLFVLLLAGLGLLRRENFGILGYLSTSHTRTRVAPDDMIEKSRRQLDREISSPWLRGLAHRLLNHLARRSTTGGGICLLRLAVFILRTGQQMRSAVLPLGKSCRAMLLLVVIGVAAGPHQLTLEGLVLFWFAGTLIAVVLQGRYLPLHFIPVLMPGSILAGLGLFKVVPAMMAGELWGLVAFGGVVGLFGLDAIYLTKRFLRSPREPLDYRIWPDSLRPMVDKNFAAREAAAFLKQHSDPDDYVLAWGCVPQLYAMSARRSPVNWLTTTAWIMDPILPSWREIFVERMRQTRPRYLFRFDDDLDLAWLERETGLHYAPTGSVGEPAIDVFELSEPIVRPV